MTVTADEIKRLVDIVGRRGAQAALCNSDLVRAEDLLVVAGDSGIHLPKRTPKAELANAIIKQLDRRISKPLDELKQLSVPEIVSYFNAVDAETEEVIELLKSIDIKNRARSRKDLFEFAANQISNLGIFERLAGVPNSSKPLASTPET